MSWFINQCENQDCRNVKMTVRANDFSMECKNFHLLTCTTFAVRRLLFTATLFSYFFAQQSAGRHHKQAGIYQGRIPKLIINDDI